MARFGSLGTQYFNNSGEVLSAGYIQFYASGTSTPIDTYADAALTVENEWPLPLDAAGRQPNCFFDGTAKAVLRSSAGVMISTADPVGETGTTFGSLWSSAEVYQIGDVVLADDGNYYESIQNSNQNNYPPDNAAWWEKLQFLATWNANVEYPDDAIVELNGILYTSQQAANLNHNPSTDVGTWWVPQGASIADEQLFAASGTWTKQAGVTFVQVELWGAGGGGGGALNTAAAENRGGGGGGGGGGYVIRLYKASDLAATVAVTIGAGGAGGNVGDGTVGGDTTFGALLTAYGGAGGVVGNNSGAVSAGGKPGGTLTAGNALSGTTYGVGDFTQFGAAGNSGGTNAIVALAGLRSLQGGPGGGGGGGLNAAGTATAGAAGGSQTQGSLTGGGGTGGAATSAAGGAGSSFQGGGGGGAGTTGGVGGAGGASGGGGGGGAGSDGMTAALGGAGGAGYGRIRSW